MNETYTFEINSNDWAAPFTIRFWISERIRLGLNSPNDEVLRIAEETASRIEQIQGKSTSQIDYESGPKAAPEFKKDIN